jgi:hypothetical protein
MRVVGEVFSPRWPAFLSEANRGIYLQLGLELTEVVYIWGPL